MKLVGKWCTVTVVTPDGRRHSIDVNAESSYDAAHATELLNDLRAQQ
jgi:hypothetical protein